MWFSCFCILPGSAEAQVIWGGIVKRLLIAYFIGNISAKNIFNPFMCVKVIASQRWDFFWDTVYYRFTALFLGPPGWAGARRELLDFMVRGKINMGRHRPSGWVPLHPDWVPTSTVPHFLQAGCPSCSPTVSKHWRQHNYSWFIILGIDCKQIETLIM